MTFTSLSRLNNNMSGVRGKKATNQGGCRGGSVFKGKSGLNPSKKIKVIQGFSIATLLKFWAGHFCFLLGGVPCRMFQQYPWPLSSRCLWQYPPQTSHLGEEKMRQIMEKLKIGDFSQNSPNLVLTIKLFLSQNISLIENNQ